MKQKDLGRFSDTTFLILSSLADSPKHGYAMMEDIRQFSGTQLEPGTLHGAITRLEKQGYGCISHLGNITYDHDYF